MLHVMGYGIFYFRLGCFTHYVKAFERDTVTWGSYCLGCKIFAYKRLRTSKSILGNYCSVRLQIKCMFVEGGGGVRNWICMHPLMSVSGYTLWNCFHIAQICHSLRVSRIKFMRHGVLTGFLRSHQSFSNPGFPNPFYSFGGFIVVLSWPRRWSLSRARRNQSISHHLIYLRYILILSFHLCVGLLNSLFLSGFSSKILYAFFFSPRVPHTLSILFCLTFWIYLVTHD
jgi:hypothetical protein